jgi:hypothetical protein
MLVPVLLAALMGRFKTFSELQRCPRLVHIFICLPLLEMSHVQREAAKLGAASHTPLSFAGKVEEREDTHNLVIIGSGPAG